MKELEAAVTAHGTSVAAGSEDFTAYARADALLAIRSWIAELGG